MARFCGVRSTLFAAVGVSALLISQGGYAQTGSPQNSPDPSPSAAPVSAEPGSPAASATLAGSARTEAAQPSEIVVTGSLIRRQDFTSATPIQTLSNQNLAQSGAGTVSDAINQMPQIAPPNPGVASAAGRAGRSPIDLRGLGPTRALVLLDGRRVQPSTGDGTIDANFLPSGLVQQVETITGGASSVYGSDAITGVVNFILRKDIHGFELRGQINAPQIGAGKSYDVQALAGHDFADDRLHTLFAVDYTNRTRALRPERDYWRFSQSSAILDRPVLNFSASAPSQAAVNTIFGQYGAAPGTVQPTTRIAVNEDGSLFTQAPNSGPVINYRGPIDQRTLIYNNSVLRNNGLDYDVLVPIKRVTGFGRAEYDVTSDTKAFVQVLFSHTHVSSQSTDTGSGTNNINAVLPVTNPFIPAALRSLLLSRSSPAGTVPFTLMLTQLGPSKVISNYDVLQTVGGVSGKTFGGAWNWNFYATYGKSTGDARQVNGESLRAMQQLLNASDGGASLCSGGFNIFGPTDAFSQSCLQYIGRTADSKESLAQWVAEASMEGPLVNLPAGKARLAVGTSYRHNKYVTNPDPLLADGDFIGAYQAYPASGTAGVKEVFGELYVPLLHNIPLIEELSVDAGYRYSRYSNFGGASTYKADAEWSMFRWLKLRGGYARAIRAPSLAELHSATSNVTATIGTASPNSFTGDPCDIHSGFRNGANASQVRQLCIAQGVPAGGVDTYTAATGSVFGTTSGNPNLKPEQGDTFTYGFVLRSPFTAGWLSNFSVSVDRYDIKVKNAIGQLPITTTLARCFNADGSNPTYSPDNFYCQFVGRSSVGFLAGNTRVPTLNLGMYHTQGIDIEADWSASLESFGTKLPGRLRANLVATHVDHFYVQPLSGATPIDYSGFSQGAITLSVMPKWKFVGNLAYHVGSAELGMRWRYIGGVQDVSKATTPSSTAPDVPSRTYIDLNAGIDGPHKIHFYGGINNLFDRDPPQVGATVGFATDQGTYDIMGRTFYIGASVKF